METKLTHWGWLASCESGIFGPAETEELAIAAAKMAERIESIPRHRRHMSQTSMRNKRITSDSEIAESRVAEQAARQIMWDSI